LHGNKFVEAQVLSRFEREEEEKRRGAVWA